MFCLHAYLCTMCMPWLWRPEDGVGFPWNWSSTDDCERARTLNFLKEQPLFLTTKPSIQPLNCIILIWDVIWIVTDFHDVTWSLPSVTLKKKNWLCVFPHPFSVSLQASWSTLLYHNLALSGSHPLDSLPLWISLLSLFLLHLRRCWWMAVMWCACLQG